MLKSLIRHEQHILVSCYFNVLTTQSYPTSMGHMLHPMVGRSGSLGAVRKSIFPYLSVGFFMASSLAIYPRRKEGDEFDSSFLPPCLKFPVSSQLMTYSCHQLTKCGRDYRSHCCMYHTSTNVWQQSNSLCATPKDLVLLEYKIQ